MGNGIAHVFAQRGYRVNLIDISPDQLEKAVATIGKNLDRMVAKEIIRKELKEAALKNITTYTSIPEGVKDVELVVEAATENQDLKLKIFKQMDEFAPENCILATNTSSISITKLASFTSRPKKFIGMHFMNPVPLMQLVEIILGHHTDEHTLNIINNLAEKMGKITTIAKDYPGFIANRILMPMINEAFFALMEGVASATDIDTTMKLGCNQPMGPLALADFIGLDTCLAILEVLHKGLGYDKYRPCVLLRNYVQAGLLGRKTQRGVFSYDL